jgi:hypothetical protein
LRQSGNIMLIDRNVNTWVAFSRPLEGAMRERRLASFIGTAQDITERRERQDESTS